MASGFDVENKLINGLVTESTALAFPKDACTDTNNCVFNEFGKVTRRPGLDLEVGYQQKTITTAMSERWTEFVWYTSAASSNKSFFIQQKGSSLYFYDITNTTVVSSSVPLIVNLTSYQPTSSSLDPSQFACRYATGNGRLFVGNGACNPIYIKWSDDSSSLTVTQIKIKFRDTNGLADTLDVNERPTASASGLATSNPKHYYNIANQGWMTSDALSQWDTARTDMPSNADTVALYRSTEDVDDAFDNAKVLAKSPGTGSAPKGHYILEIGTEDRSGAVVADGGATLSFTGGVQKISVTGKTRIGSAWSDFQYINDGDTTGNNNASVTSTNPYAGVDLGSAKAIFSCRLYPKTSGTDTSNKGFVVSSVANSSTSLVLKLYAKSTLPTSATDGTLLGTFSGNDDVVPVNITSSDTSTTYRYVWATFAVGSGSSVLWALAEFELYAPSTAVTYERPACISFFAGRLWYAGLNQDTKGSNLYFSQTCIDDTRYGLCYQKNDPTSEDFADLLADDGGVVNIPEMGKVQALFSFQSQLMVFADNGVWIIRGPSSSSFAATGYLVQRITNIGMSSPLSVVDIKGVPCWWAEDGIYTITYDANYDSTTVKSLTEETIKTVILSVPSANRPYIKAAFDRLNNYCYWSYSDTVDATITQAQQHNKFIVFNAKTNAFFPWSIDNTISNTPILQGICYVQDGSRSASGNFKIKLPVTYTISGTTSLTYADFSDATNWKDWDQYATLISSSSNRLDYSSYIVAGYRLDGQAIRNFRSHYIWTFMNDLTDSSVFLQGIWDFTNNSLSGKWSTPQQAYNSLTTRGRTYDDVRVTRRVVRGSGKALQVKYYSESGKPFEIIGWGLFESGQDGA